MAGTTLRQLRLVKAAEVYKAGERAGILRRLADRTEFSYLPAYLDRRGQALAWSIPANEGIVTAPAAAVPAFFAGLLPEGRRLTALRRGVGTSADDEFSMLLAVGSDTIGDVQVVPAGEPPIPSTAIEIDDFSTADFAELFAEAVGPRSDRTGLPGIQDKVSGRMVNMPVAGRSGSYILKLNPPEFPHLVANGFFFFKAAARTRIRLAEVELVRDRHQSPGLLVRRFDRLQTAGAVKLLAVEDVCQVLGRWPGDKYVVPTEDAFTALARCCRAPGVAAMELLRLLIFAYLSGNGELHAKNLAVLRNLSGEWRISPAYDLASSAF